jgi:hypothetical protein
MAVTQTTAAADTSEATSKLAASAQRATGLAGQGERPAITGEWQQAKTGI